MISRDSACTRRVVAAKARKGKARKGDDCSEGVDHWWRHHLRRAARHSRHLVDTQGPLDHVHRGLVSSDLLAHRRADASEALTAWSTHRLAGQPAPSMRTTAASVRESPLLTLARLVCGTASESWSVGRAAVRARGQVRRAAPGPVLVSHEEAQRRSLLSMSLKVTLGAAQTPQVPIVVTSVTLVLEHGRRFWRMSLDLRQASKALWKT